MISYISSTYREILDNTYVVKFQETVCDTFTLHKYVKNFIQSDNNNQSIIELFNLPFNYRVI